MNCNVTHIEGRFANVRHEKHREKLYVYLNSPPVVENQPLIAQLRGVSMFFLFLYLLWKTNGAFQQTISSLSEVCHHATRVVVSWDIIAINNTHPLDKLSLVVVYAHLYGVSIMAYCNMPPVLRLLHRRVPTWLLGTQCKNAECSAVRRSFKKTTWGIAYSPASIVASWCGYIPNPLLNNELLCVTC